MYIVYTLKLPKRLKRHVVNKLGCRVVFLQYTYIYEIIELFRLVGGLV